MSSATLNEKWPKVYTMGDNFYGIQQKEDREITIQRRRVLNTTDSPLSTQEEIIIAFCNLILGKE